MMMAARCLTPVICTGPGLNLVLKLDRQCTLPSSLHQPRHVSFFISRGHTFVAKKNQRTEAGSASLQRQIHQPEVLNHDIPAVKRVESNLSSGRHHMNIALRKAARNMYCKSTSLNH